MQSFISEMPPLYDRKERIYFIFSLFFVQNLISEMPPLYDRNVLTILCKNVCRKCNHLRIYLYICECDKDFTCFYYCGTEISDLPNWRKRRALLLPCRKMTKSKNLSAALIHYYERTIIYCSEIYDENPHGACTRYGIVAQCPKRLGTVTQGPV